MSNRKRDAKPASKAGRGSKPRAGSASPSTIPALTPGMQQLQTFLQGMDPAAQSTSKNAFLYFTQSIVGKPVHVRSKDGFAFDGVFSVLAPRDDSKSYFVFKGARVKSGTPPANFENGAVLVVESDKIAQISVASVNLQIRHRPDGLSTDSEIGKRDLSHLMNRELQAADSWVTASSAASLDLDDAKVKGWDQFKVNEQLFDVKTSFDENLYTTRLDKSKITAEQEQEAARIARLIESQRSSNVHLAEERGQATEHEYDEEDLYSGVVRPATSNANDPTKYRPPSQRKLASQKLQTKQPAGEADGTGSPRSPTTTAASPVAAASAEEPRKESPKPVTPTPEQPAAAAAGTPTAERAATPTGPATAEPTTEKPVEAAAPAPAPAPATEEKPAEKKKPTLNPAAKEFHFNPNAKEFVPPVLAAQPAPAPAYPPTSMAPHLPPAYGAVPMPAMPVEPVVYPPYEMYDPNMMMPPMHMGMEEQYAQQYYGYAAGGMPPPPPHMDASYMHMQPVYMPPQPNHMHSAHYPPARMSPGQHHRYGSTPYGGGEEWRGNHSSRGRGRPRTGSVGSHSDSGRR